MRSDRTKVADIVAERIDQRHLADAGWAWRMISATHLVRCLLARLPYVTLRSGYVWTEQTEVGKSLERCREKYGSALQCSAGRFSALLAGKSCECHDELLDQLQRLVGMEAADPLPYVQLLEFSAALAGQSGRVIALDERSVQDKFAKAFNLEELLARCIRQTNDFQDFCTKVAPILIPAACAGFYMPDSRVRRISHCASRRPKGSQPVELQNQLGQPNFELCCLSWNRLIIY